MMRRTGRKYSSASKSGAQSAHRMDLDPAARKRRRHGSVSASSTAAPWSPSRLPLQPPSQSGSQSYLTLGVPSQSSAPTVPVPAHRRLDLAPTRSSESPGPKALDASGHVRRSVRARTVNPAYRLEVVHTSSNECDSLDNDREDEAMGVPLTFLAGPEGTLGLTPQPGDRTPHSPPCHGHEAGHGKGYGHHLCQGGVQDSDDTIPESQQSSPPSARLVDALQRNHLRLPRPAHSRPSHATTCAQPHTSSRAGAVSRTLPSKKDNYGGTDHLRSSTTHADNLHTSERTSMTHVLPCCGQVHVYALHAGDNQPVTSQELASRARAAVLGAFGSVAPLIPQEDGPTYTTSADPIAGQEQDRRGSRACGAGNVLFSRDAEDQGAGENKDQDGSCSGPTLANRLIPHRCWDPVPSSFQPELEEILVPVSGSSSPRSSADLRPAGQGQSSRPERVAWQEVECIARDWKQTLAQEMAGGWFTPEWNTVRWEHQLMEKSGTEIPEANSFAIGCVSLRVPPPEMESLPRMWNTVLRICGVSSALGDEGPIRDPDPHGPIGADVVLDSAAIITTLGDGDNNNLDPSMADSILALAIRVHFLAPFQQATFDRLGALGVTI